MAKCLIVVFTYDRPYITKLCIDFFLSSDLTGLEVEIFDGGSTSNRLIKYLCTICDDSEITCKFFKRGTTLDTVEMGNKELGIQRSRAVEYFLSAGEWEYLFLLDSDILVRGETIKEAIEDFEAIRASHLPNPGMLTLHALSKFRNRHWLNQKVFVELVLTGEATLLIHRDTLLRIGNHFGPHEKGFADTQIKATLKANYVYYERVHPSYEVQHLGFGHKGSAIYQMGKIPRWARMPFTSNWPLDVVQNHPLIPIEGFDICKYQELINIYGGEEAARKFAIANVSESLEVS